MLKACKRSLILALSFLSLTVLATEPKPEMPPELEGFYTFDADYGSPPVPRSFRNMEAWVFEVPREELDVRVSRYEDGPYRDSPTIPVYVIPKLHKAATEQLLKRGYPVKKIYRASKMTSHSTWLFWDPQEPLAAFFVKFIRKNHQDRKSHSTSIQINDSIEGRLKRARKRLIGYMPERVGVLFQSQGLLHSFTIRALAIHYGVRRKGLAASFWVPILGLKHTYKYEGEETFKFLKDVEEELAEGLFDLNDEDAVFPESHQQNILVGIHVDKNSKPHLAGAGFRDAFDTAIDIFQILAHGQRVDLDAMEEWPGLMQQHSVLDADLKIPSIFHASFTQQLDDIFINAPGFSRRSAFLGHFLGGLYKKFQVEQSQATGAISALAGEDMVEFYFAAMDDFVPLARSLVLSPERMKTLEAYQDLLKEMTFRAQEREEKTGSPHLFFNHYDALAADRKMLIATAFYDFHRDGLLAYHPQSDGKFALFLVRLSKKERQELRAKLGPQVKATQGRAEKKTLDEILPLWMKLLPSSHDFNHLVRSYYLLSKLMNKGASEELKGRILAILPLVEERILELRESSKAPLYRVHTLSPAQFPRFLKSHLVQDFVARPEKVDIPMLLGVCILLASAKSPEVRAILSPELVTKIYKLVDAFYRENPKEVHSLYPSDAVLLPKMIRDRYLQALAGQGQDHKIAIIIAELERENLERSLCLRVYK
jgi:hypothetical protein